MAYKAKVYDEKTRTQKVWLNSSMLKYMEMVEDPEENYGDLTVVFNNGSTYRYKKVALGDYVFMVGGGIDGSNGKAFNQFVKLTAELCNRFNLTEKICLATRLYAGANVPLGNSDIAPLSEAFYAGGPNSLRAAEPYSYGPGNFHSFKYNQSFFHAGDIKLEANLELRFPIFWKIFGAAFLDAGNVWGWNPLSQTLAPEDCAWFIDQMGITEELKESIINNPDLARQIALGTGAGLRLDLDGLVIRLDLGVSIHAPYQTYKYSKDGTPDLTQPITSYYNIPSILDGLRLNFGVGYPF